MGVAPGGLIEQFILEDHFPADSWDRQATVFVNVQILNSERFRSVTGLAPPKSPISAKTYADLGLPYYKIWKEETSSVKGDFKRIKSVKAIDKVKAVLAKNGYRNAMGSWGAEEEEEEEEEERNPPNQPVVLLKSNGRSLGFRAVSELEREIASKRSVQF